MKKNLILLMAIGILSATASFGFQKPITIKEQGSFMAGGTVVTSPGEYKDSEPMNFDGETLHGDHAYVFYQKPVKAKKNSIVFLHGYGQSGKSWESDLEKVVNILNKEVDSDSSNRLKGVVEK